MKYKFIISYIYRKLQWFGAVYLVYNDLKEMYRMNDDFDDPAGVIGGYNNYYSESMADDDVSLTTLLAIKCQCFILRRPRTQIKDHLQK